MNEHGSMTLLEDHEASEAIRFFVNAARKEAFLEAAGIAEEVAIEVSGTGWADAKARADSVRAVERHLRAKAAE